VIARLRFSQMTVRWRLTLLYGALFLASGTLLLLVTYLLVAHAGIIPPPKLAPGVKWPPAGRGGTPVSILFGRQRIANVDALIVDSAIALAGMTIASGLLGWVVAGRVLRPLRAITTVTEEISETNLSERLAISGPRDELRRLADSIDGLLARLEVAFDAQRRFVANASHELRTPLTRMRASLDVAIAKPGGVPPQVRALDANLREDLDLVDRLFDSFLTLAHAQNGQLREHAPVSLAEIVDSALEDRRDAIAEKAIVVEATITPIKLAGSETLLRRMVDNVIENAALYSPPHGLIRVALGLDRDDAELVVESDGPPLDQTAVAQLAQPFRRLGADRTGSHTGHGLGLSIVAAIATAHRGTLELGARPTGGLRVQITLPGASAIRELSAAL